jgi:hypothetical protein
MLNLYPTCIITITLILLSITKPHSIDQNVISDLNNVNSIEIRYLKAGKPLKQVVVDKQTISFFKDLVKDGKEKRSLNCDSTGEILYFTNKTQVFKAFFSTRITGSKFATDAITYTLNNHTICTLLTYNTGMDIDGFFYQLRSK